MFLKILGKCMMALVLVFGFGGAQAQVATTPGGNVNFIGGGTLFGLINDNWAGASIQPLIQIAPTIGGPPIFADNFQITDLTITPAGPLVGAASNFVIADCAVLNTATTPDSCEQCILRWGPVTPNATSPASGGFSHTFNTGPGIPAGRYVCVGNFLSTGAGNTWWVTVRGYRFSL